MTFRNIRVSITDMNIALKRKTYSIARRQELAKQTRERILKAVSKIITRKPANVLSIKAVAKAAKVSDRTVYRHFPTRDSMLRAFWGEFAENIGMMDFPNTEEELLAAPPRIFAGLDRDERFIRSYLASDFLGEIRRKVDKHRKVSYARCIERAAEGLSSAEKRRAIALIQVLFSAPAWQVLRDRAGLTGAQAGRVVSWGIEVILRELRVRRTVSAKDDDDVP